jgi:O-antigen/teichoic acid export membrane protein
MVARHTITYLGSRGLAAVTNVVSLAVLTRLASPDSYGLYVLILSWAFILCGFCCQWSKFAFFALYREESAQAQIATLLRILVCALATLALGCASAVALGLVRADVAAAIVAVACGMTVFEGASEVSRTRLEIGAVAAAVVSRALLLLVLGSGTLLVSDSAVHLAFAAALSNVLAVWLPTFRLGGLALAPGSLREAARFLGYGWPLILSFGVTALGQNVDRLVLSGNIAVGSLGAYGAIADFLKQSFVVFGEAIALSLISIAKRDLREGNRLAARAALEDASRTLTLVAAFGAAFVLTFADLIAAVVLGPEFRAEAVTLAPYLVAANVFLIFRAYYFGQIIYFAGTSHLDLMSSLVLCGAVGGLSLLLVPLWGVTGAAIALVIGQGLACLVFVAAAGLRGSPQMPFPLRDVAGVLVVAGLCWTLAMAIRAAPQFGVVTTAALALAVLSAGFAGTAWRLNILGLGDRIRIWRERTA